MPEFAMAPPPEVTLTTGFRSADQHLDIDVKLDVDEDMYWVQPEATPFITMLGSAEAPKKVKDVHNYEFHWPNKSAYPEFATVAAAATAGATSITLETNHGLRLGDNMLVRNRRTGELVLAVATTASSISTAVRGVGTAGGVAMEIGDQLALLMPGYPDASGKGTGRNVQERFYSNKCQIGRWPFEFSGRDLETEFYSGDDLENETRHQIITAKMLWERLFIFGRPFERTGANGKIQSFMGGLRHFITQMEWDLGNTEPSERAFVEFLEYAMRYGRGGRWHGKGVKYLYHPAKLGTMIEFWAKDRLKVLPNFQEKLGLEVKEYVSTQGRIRLINDPILDPEGVAFLIDHQHVRMRRFRNRGWKILKGREANDIDGKSYEIFADLSLQSDGVEDGEPHAAIFGESLRS